MKRELSSVLHSTKLRRLRALKMIEMRVLNKSVATIAKEFNVSEKTVTRTLSWAEKAGIVADAEDKILRELLPAAHKALKRALEDEENKQEAGKLGFQLFQTTLGKPAKGDKVSKHDESDELAKHIAFLRGGHGVADGEVITSEPLGALPAAKTQDGHQGLDAPTGLAGLLHLGPPQGEEEVGSDGPAVSAEGVE